MKLITKTSFPILFAVTTLGISSVITQITLTRELLNIFQGNELIVGLIISIWLVLTGAGAYLGRFQKWKNGIFILSLVAVSFLPFLHIIALRSFRFTATVPGAIMDPRVLFVSLPLLLLPYCLISGYLLTLACSLLSEGERALNIGTIYFIDNIGDILGGLLFSFVLIFILSTYDSLYVPGFLNLIAAVAACIHFKYYKSSLAVLCLLPLLCLSIAGNMDNRSMSRLYPFQDLVRVTESLYGRIVVTRDREQYTFFENGIPFFSTGNTLQAEEAVHFALSQLPDRELSVLLLSGGITGTPREILKYPVKWIDYVELDPEIISLGNKFTDYLKSKRIRIHATDGRRFVERSHDVYDAILIDLPSPMNIQLNRFYSVEFFTLLKEKLAPDGVISFSLPGAENYINKELSDLYQIIHATVKQVFLHVAGFPVSSAVFIASDNAINTDIGGALNKRDIQTVYVNAYYLKGMLTKDRMEQMNAHLTPSETVNRDLHPAAFRFQLKYWLSFFDININWLTWIFILAGMLLIILYSPVEATLLTTGFTSISLEIVILLLFQIHSGHIYYKFGILISLFMAGLAAGSYAANKLLGTLCQDGSRGLLLRLETVFIIFLLVIGVVIGWTSIWRSDILLYLTVTAAAMLTGAEFPSAGVWVKKSVEITASRLYTADFLGAGIGSFLSAVILVPALGVKNTVWILLLVKSAGFIKLIRKR